MVFGFVRETEKEAQEDGTDPTGVPRTGLDTYLAAIFPDVNDWIHDKTFPGMRTRPDYRSNSLRMLVEFDGIPHFRSRKEFLKDVKKTAKYQAAGYRVVRIPLYINLTTNVINKLFGTNLQQDFFTENVSPFNETFQPNTFCITGLKRMADDFKSLAPEQIPLMMESIREKSPDEYEYLKSQGL